MHEAELQKSVGNSNWKSKKFLDIFGLSGRCMISRSVCFIFQLVLQFPGKHARLLFFLKNLVVPNKIHGLSDNEEPMAPRQLLLILFHFWILQSFRVGCLVTSASFQWLNTSPPSPTTRRQQIEIPTGGGNAWSKINEWAVSVNYQEAKAILIKF